MQFLNAFLPIDFIEGGIVIISSDEQLLNAYFLIDFNDDGFSKIAYFNDEHSLNELSPTEVTDDGMNIFDNDEHPKKRWLSIVSIDDGRDTFISEEQP